MSDLITERLKSALNKETDATKEIATQAIEEQTKEEVSKVVTSTDELEGFMIVKAILRQKIDVGRIVYRDSQTYFAILLDDNNRKPICRLYLNGGKKYIATFDEQKKEVKNEIVKLDDIFKYSALLLNCIDSYSKVKE